MRRAGSSVISFKRAVLMSAMCAAMTILEICVLVLRNSRHPLFSDGLSFLHFCLAAEFVSLTVRFLIIAVRKTRAKEHTG